MNKMFENLKVKITNLMKELKGDIVVSDRYPYDYDQQKRNQTTVP